MDIDLPKDLASTIATNIVISKAIIVLEATNKVAAKNSEHSKHASNSSVTIARSTKYTSITKN